MLNANLIAEAIYRSVKDLDEKQAKIMIKNAVQILADRGYMSELKKSHVQIQTIADEHNGLVIVNIESAYKLTEETLNLIANKLDISKEKIKFIQNINKNVVSGFIARTKDLQLNSTIINQVNQFIS